MWEAVKYEEPKKNFIWIDDIWNGNGGTAGSGKGGSK